MPTEDTGEETFIDIFIKPSKPAEYVTFKVILTESEESKNKRLKKSCERFLNMRNSS